MSTSDTPDPAAGTSDPPLVQQLRVMLDAYEVFDTYWRLDWGLSATEKLVITHLWACERSTMGEIATRVGLTSGGATSLVNRLERDGYLTRADDPVDRRRSIVTLTTKGWESRAVLDAALTRIAEEPGAEVGAPLLAAMSRVLEDRAARMRAQLEKQVID